MRNQHPGTCYRCGERVGPRKGHFERVNPDRMRKMGIDEKHWRGKRWVVQHAGCAIAYRRTEQAADCLKAEADALELPNVMEGSR